MTHTNIHQRGMQCWNFNVASPHAINIPAATRSTDSPGANHVESCQAAHQTGAVPTAHHGGAAHQVCRLQAPTELLTATLEQANPAAVIHQMQIMLKDARMHTNQARYRPPTTAAPLTRSASLQLPTVLLKATPQQQTPRR